MGYKSGSTGQNHQVGRGAGKKIAAVTCLHIPPRDRSIHSFNRVTLCPQHGVISSVSISHLCHTRFTPMKISSRSLRIVVAITAVLGIGYTLWLQIVLVQSGRVVFRRPSTVIGDYTDLVNVFIGTRYSGHVFPGATLPHGMVKVGMDTDSNENVSGDVFMGVRNKTSTDLVLRSTLDMTQVRSGTLQDSASCTMMGQEGVYLCQTSKFGRCVNANPSRNVQYSSARVKRYVHSKTTEHQTTLARRVILHRISQPGSMSS